MCNETKGALGCLGEIIGELVITVAAFGIGWLILAALGIEIDSENVDFDLVVLLGIVAFAIACAIVYLVVRAIKRGRRGGIADEPRGKDNDNVLTDGSEPCDSADPCSENDAGDVPNDQ